MSFKVFRFSESVCQSDLTDVLLSTVLLELYRDFTFISVVLYLNALYLSG